jgi:hypothetical protein
MLYLQQFRCVRQLTLLLASDVLQWLSIDRATFLVCASIHMTAVGRLLLLPREQAAIFLLAVGCASIWAFATIAPRCYLRLRTPIITAIRGAEMLLPLALDLIDALQPIERLAAGKAAADDSGLGPALHASAGLFLMISWVVSSVVMALGMQLPPWQHLAMQLATSLLHCYRAPLGKCPYNLLRLLPTRPA